jgi:glutathionylspermidine synthase
MEFEIVDGRYWQNELNTVLKFKSIDVMKPKIKELYDRVIHLTDKAVIKEKDKNTFTFENIIGCSPIFLIARFETR